MSYAHTSHYTDGPWLLQGARVADPPTGLWARRDVLIVDNEVKTIAPEMKAHEEVQESGGLPQVIDASDLWIWPGLVDLHVHFREPGLVHKETLATGGDAALSGGYSCVVCEPNTDPPLADVNILRKVAGKAWDDTPLRVFFKAAMTSGRNGKEPADIEALARLNTVVGVSDDGDPIVRFDVMEEVFRRSAAVGLPVCPHCEDSKRSREAQQRGVDPGFPVGKYQENEARYIQRDAGVAAKWGVPAHFSHVSLEESLN
ncbi:MAG: amidohydrolase family protein, partial [Planctomycetota bacterium]